MRVFLFTGSRGWRDVRTVENAIDGFRKPFLGIVGDAGGFDSIVWDILTEWRLPRWRFKAKWRTKGYYDHAAGHKRSRLMASWASVLGDPANCVVGWDGKSPGTKGCVDEAKRLGIDVWPLQYIRGLNEGKE